MDGFIKGIPIDLVISKYKELNNVWKVGKLFGISGQTIHYRLSAIGVINKMNYFTDEDKQVLAEKYVDYKTRGMIKDLAKELGRTEAFICRKAKELGLTWRVKKYNYSDEKRLQLSISAKNRILKYGHPRGSLGLVHTDSTKIKISEASKKNWSVNRDKICNPIRRRIISDNMMNMQEDGTLGVTHSRGYMHKVEIGNKTLVVKSSWEYNIALYLEYLKEKELITDWEYESKKFVFNYNTLGVRSYKPDFTVIRGDRVYYIEVKGWEDRKYEIKRKLMEDEYPNVKIIYIRNKEYRIIQRKYSTKFPSWGKIKDIAGKKESICMIEDCNNPVHSKGLCRHHFYQIYHK